jgi:hypothetical protein
MANDGKDLQRLIRIIESARAAGRDIKIESPKFFRDKVTGQQREHDVVLTIMADLRVATMKSWERAGPNSRRRYEATKEDHFPATFDEYIAAVDPLIPMKVSMNAIIKAIDNVQIGTQINGMFWGVVDISNGPRRFLTSDRPLQYAFLREPRGFISLPISPTKLFVASNNNEGISNLRRLKPQEVARQANIWSVARARRFVIAHDDSQEVFIEKHIGTKMEPSPLFPSILK